MMSHVAVTLHFSNSVNEYKKFNFPDEDSSLVRDNYWGVFDGVTLLHQKPYPNPSPAYKAAMIAATVTAETGAGAGSGEEKLRKAFTRANRAIAEFNNKRGVTLATTDFLQKQLAATVGAFGFLEEKTLYFGQINDCGVRIYDQGRLIVDQIIDRRPTDEFLEFMERELHFRSMSPEQHVYFRKNIVNNPDVEISGKKIGFGVMDGNPMAERFFVTSKTRVSPGATAVFYSDGFLPFFDEEKFNQLLCSGSEEELRQYVEKLSLSSKEFQKEKTLVAARF